MGVSDHIPLWKLCYPDEFPGEFLNLPSDVWADIELRLDTATKRLSDHNKQMENILKEMNSLKKELDELVAANAA
jgi:predicted DNA-binding helix-hairpin-helix protein